MQRLNRLKQIDRVRTSMRASVNLQAIDWSRRIPWAKIFLHIPELCMGKFRPRGPEDCWPWEHGKSDGYGMVWDPKQKQNVLVHRLMYEANQCKIPEGKQIDHLCRNRACINPSHMEPVTIGENVLRGEGPTARNAQATHCLSGHAFDDANTYIRKDGTGRACRICVKLAVRESRRRAKS